MHIAACQLTINGQPRHSGEEVPEFVTWPAAVQAHHIRQGSVVFVPVSTILAVAPLAAEAAHRKGRP